MKSADFKSLAEPKVRFNLLSSSIHMRRNVDGSIFCTKKRKKHILKKANSIKGLASVWFFKIKRHINVESHMYKVTK